MANKNIEVTTFVDDCEKIVNIGGVLVWDLKDVLNPIYQSESVTINSDAEAKEMLGISDAFIDLVFNKGAYPNQILLLPNENETISFLGIETGGGGYVITKRVHFAQSRIGAPSEITITRHYNTSTRDVTWAISKAF